MARKNQIRGQFGWRTIAMLESAAYRALSLSAHRILARLEIELAHHGGTETANGALICRYDDFEAYGIDRHSIWPAINEATQLGFVEIVERGAAGNESFRRPAKYRLTYRHSTGKVDPTDEWALIKTLAEARTIAAAARQVEGRNPAKGRRRTAAPKSGSPVGKNPAISGGKPTKVVPFPVGRSPTTSASGEPPTTSNISGGSRDAAPSDLAA